MFRHLYDTFAVPSNEVLDRRFEVFVAIDLGALLETSVLKRMKKIS